MGPSTEDPNAVAGLPADHAHILQTGAFLDITAAGVRALEVACGPCIGYEGRHRS
ncbi:MAG: hypothetical protein AABY63_10005 [candidate division NC10 bacterium]